MFVDESKPPKMKLECMGEYQFPGNVMAMESMPLSLARDALLLCFEDAKLSIVEYDPETHDLRTISLHYFETDDLHVSLYPFLCAKIANIICCHLSSFIVYF